MFGTPDHVARSITRVTKFTSPPRFPYALSEIRAFYKCGAELSRMTTLEGAEGLIRIIAEDAKLTVVRSDPVFIGGDGDGYGYTLNCTLTESGVAYDCWPEYRTVIQYLDLCNVTKDNGAKADALWPFVAAYFGATLMYAVPRIVIPIDPSHLILE